MMDEVILKKELSEYESTIAETLLNIEKAKMALEELINQYDIDITPTAKKALEYGNTVNASSECDTEAKFSWKYIYEYKKIMWLVNVAKDYCTATFEQCKKTYEGGAANE